MKVFISVVDEGAFGKAAARENITQPAATMIVNQIEEELGANLFERVGTVRRARLTSKGRDVADAFRNIIATFETELSDISEDQPGQKISRFAVQSGLGIGLKTDFETLIQPTSNGSIVIIEELPLELIIEQLNSRHLQMGIILGDAQSLPCDMRHIGDEDLVLVTPDGSLEDEEFAYWESLPNFCFVSEGLGGKVIRQIENRWHETHRRSQSLVRMRNSNLIGQQMRALNCPLITSRRFAAELTELDGLHCLSFEGDTIPLPIYAAGQRSAFLEPTFRALRNSFSR